MVKVHKNVMLVNGTLRRDGVTFYTRKGQTIMRSAISDQPKRRSRKQFDVRQRMKHTTRLWGILKEADPIFSGGSSAFGRFCHLMAPLPVVYSGKWSNAALLLPYMPVSDGPLPVIHQSLGTVNGTPALITDLKRDSLKRREKLRLYTASQEFGSHDPYVVISQREVSISEFCDNDGHIALTGEEFADEMKGWALVRVYEGRCSSQSIVTRCHYYETYTTQEAMEASAKSYGGLTYPPFLMPDDD